MIFLALLSSVSCMNADTRLPRIEHAVFEPFPDLPEPGSCTLFDFFEFLSAGFSGLIFRVLLFMFQPGINAVTLYDEARAAESCRLSI